MFGLIIRLTQIFSRHDMIDLLHLVPSWRRRTSRVIMFTRRLVSLTATDSSTFCPLKVREIFKRQVTSHLSLKKTGANIAGCGKKIVNVEVHLLVFLVEISTSGYRVIEKFLTGVLLFLGSLTDRKKIFQSITHVVRRFNGKQNVNGTIHVLQSFGTAS